MPKTGKVEGGKWVFGILTENNIRTPFLYNFPEKTKKRREAFAALLRS
jgi:hypothetical protein